MKKRKLKLRKSVVFLFAISILLVASSSFKRFSFALPTIGREISVKNDRISEYVSSLNNLVSEKNFDNKFTNVVSIEDDRYISKIFNFKTGEEVTIEDVLKPEMVDVFWEKVKELLYLKYPKFIASKLELHDKTNSFYLKENELIIYYYDYEIEPMVSEELSLHVNYNEIKACMNITIKLDKTYENEDGNKIDKNKKIIALTFDDGPGPYTSNLVDILKDNKAIATFFMLGKNINIYKDTVLKVHESGMEIGYHSYNHKNFKRQKLEVIKEEFDKSNEVLKNITGNTFYLIRPPYGEINDKIKDVLDASFILWNIDTMDWRHKNSDYLVNYVLEKAEDGNIILFHDIHKTSVDAIEKLLPELYVNGYQVVTVSKLAEITGTNLELHKTYRYFKK